MSPDVRRLAILAMICTSFSMLAVTSLAPEGARDDEKVVPLLDVAP